ncbi:Regulatory protein PchR [Mariniflexile rhizosphaerae]|uniref:helix-turn-helix domain-containing protein n=1 Tax=unclassified Mariniflexile TaxID=2643887 RepID=UPI000E3366C7|nr:helix-turn-helix domain-containing protein [Mariniflexile sp. TRM1-10]AXP82745.1 Regulatory protein PchR [Mariniflexile sp. TRM1-10]
MDKHHNQERIVAIHQMLFEMARGNFSNRIPLSSYDDELETLVVLINMVAEEMKESIFHAGYVNPHSTYRFITQTNLVLDHLFVVKSFNPTVLTILGYESFELIGQSIEAFITTDSFQKLNFVKEAFQDDLSNQTMIPLHFLTKEQLIISADCSITTLFNRDEIILSFVVSVPQNANVSLELNNTEEIEKHPNSRKSDAQLIQKVYDYILAHLEEPLPSLKELSKYFGTNEYKLKDGFRHFFKTSIYKFYTIERLKRAFLMIQQTTIPLKNIATMNGFTDYPNFSKSFKKQFEISPNEVARISKKDT